jgi:hypothetical protein
MNAIVLLPMLKTICLRLGIVVLTVFASSVVPAENARQGDRSTSRFSLSLSILPTLSIEAVSDVHFNIERRDVDANYQEFFCVRGTGSTRYSITAYGSNSDGQSFILTNNSGDNLLYSVAYRGNTNTEIFDQLRPGLASPVYETLPGNDPCDGQANFNIRFSAEDLEDANSGLYNGSLTLVVAPV